MTKRLVDINEESLSRARAELGTRTIKDTVNEALRVAVGDRQAKVAAALDILATAPPVERDEAWR